LTFSFGRWEDLSSATRFGVTLRQAAPGTQPWGGPVEGVQVHLRADKEVWRAGEIPTFKAEIRNQGSRELSVIRAQVGCKLQFDGKWYEHHEIGAKSSPLGPGRHYTDILISLYDRWRDPKTDAPLDLRPGKHNIRIKFILRPTDGGHRVIPMSNPVEIEIRPAANARARRQEIR